VRLAQWSGAECIHTGWTAALDEPPFPSSRNSSEARRMVRAGVALESECTWARVSLINSRYGRDQCMLEINGGGAVPSSLEVRIRARPLQTQDRHIAVSQALGLARATLCV
jgi:hypothetical protein